MDPETLVYDKSNEVRDTQPATSGIVPMRDVLCSRSFCRYGRPDRLEGKEPCRDDCDRSSQMSEERKPKVEGILSEINEFPAYR